MSKLVRWFANFYRLIILISKKTYFFYLVFGISKTMIKYPGKFL
jgi:hypothetical protein